MEKLFERIDFVNGTNPALNATNLNLMSKAISDIDDRLVKVANNMYDLVGLKRTLELADYVEKANVALSTSGTKTVTFTDSRINATSAVEPWCSDETVTFDRVTAANGSCTLIIPRQSTTKTVLLRIYFK